MPMCEVAENLDRAQAFAENTDRLKQRGLYVDVDRRGRIREPSEVTAAEVREQFDRARESVAAANALLDTSAPQWFGDSEPAGAKLSRALVSAFGEMGLARSPEAAADVLRNAVTKVRG